MPAARTSLLAAGAAALLARGALGSVPPEVAQRGHVFVPVSAREPSPGDREGGRKLYGKLCAPCHGAAGDGKGPAADRLRPRPRDLTSGLFKRRSTLSGELPTDEDLFALLREGMPGTSMPGWGKVLPQEAIWQLVAYVKSLCPDFEEFPPQEQLVLDEAPEATRESLRRGREMYRKLQCAKCHGETGRGDGVSPRELRDDWGRVIVPTNLRRRGAYRCGSTPRDICRTLLTGMSGTPMPSFASALSPREAWDLANYLSGLARSPRRALVVRAGRVEAVPEDPEAPEWAAAPAVDIRLAGQLLEEARLFTPANEEITVRALYDERSVGLLLAWDDPTEDLGEGDELADRLLVQLAPSGRAGEPRPWVFLGDPEHPVECWEWSPSGARRLGARGPDSVEPLAGAIESHLRYGGGRYRVVLKRARSAAPELGIRFAPGRFVPVAFHLWDGASGEEGTRRAISAWYYLLLEPRVRVSVLLWPAIAAGLSLGAEIALWRRLRRERGNRS